MKFKYDSIHKLLLSLMYENNVFMHI